MKGGAWMPFQVALSLRDGKAEPCSTKRPASPWMRVVAAAYWLMLIGVGDVRADDRPFAGKVADYHGFERHDFEVDGKPAIVVVPKAVALGKPWIWRAEFFDHRPEIDLALLGKGFHLVPRPAHILGDRHHAILIHIAIIN